MNKESERKAFVNALKKNEDDTTTRLVFADWLDEHGEHEEADRMRKWPAAKEWLVKFCEENNSSAEQVNEETDDGYYDGEWVISYETLLQLGRDGIARDGQWYGFSCGNNMTMCDALREHCEEFWKNWSIVTGIPLPPDVAEKSGFGCAC